MTNQIEAKRKRGLASCAEDVRHRVAKAGGNAEHNVRGLQAVSPELRASIARKGGLTRGEQIRKSKVINRQKEIEESQNVIQVPQRVS